jgi:hypothetical protein
MNPRIALAIPLTLCALVLAASPAGAQCDILRRGDSNSDGLVDIGDPVTTLNALFAGERGLGCEDAADADDSGAIDISDAVYTLNHLFLGGPPPAPPGPDACGRDPTPDNLFCFQQVCGRAPLLVDESGFETFHYSQHPGFGFCSEIGKIIEASIERVGNGAYGFEHSILEKGIAGDPECIPHFGAECAIVVPQPTRLLSPAEAERVRSAFEEIAVNVEADIICQCVAIDPCSISMFQWDESSRSDFLCQPPYLEREDADAIRGLLESLRPPP